MSKNKQIQGTGIPTNMGLDHVGIVVPNAQKAANFLIEVFDAEFDWELKREARPTAGERGWSKIFSVEEASYMPHVIMLKCGEQPLTQYVELFEWQSTAQQPLEGEGGWHKFNDVGNSYISFTVKDMDAVVKHIKDNVIPKYDGVRFIQDPPMQFPLRGEVCTSTFLVSPWGMWIELTAWSKSQHKGTVIKAQRQPESNSYLGKHINALPTPAFMIDLDVVDHNCQLMRSRIVEPGCEWRIPSKAHKCPDLSKYIFQHGAKGVVLLTLEEAEAFATQGINDIYLANQVGTLEGLTRLSLLAKQIKRLRVSIDNTDYLQELADAVDQWEIITPIEVLLELNVNHNRCGVSIEEAVSLAVKANHIEMTSGSVKFMGITGYEGHTPILPPDEKRKETAISHDILRTAKYLIEQKGIKVEVISGAGSCNYIDALNNSVLTEIQAGGGAVCDLLYFHKAHLKDHGHLMGSLMLAQLISVPSDKRRAIANAGFKSIGMHPFGGLPQCRDRDDLEIVGLSAEHTRIMPKIPGGTVSLNRGDKIVLIPGYTDAMGFMHKELYAIRNDHVEHVWQTIQ